MAPRRARTRSEVKLKEQIDRLLQILRIVGEVIRTAGTGDRYLLDLQPNMMHRSLRPPPLIYFDFFEPPKRARERCWMPDGTLPWGHNDYNINRERRYCWGTIQ